MNQFPKHFSIPRDGGVVPVTVRSVDELRQVRAELELLRRVHHQLMLRQTQAEPTPSGKYSSTDKREFTRILQDARHPLVGEMIDHIDAEFTDLRRGIAMSVLVDEAELLVHGAVESGVARADENEEHDDPIISSANTGSVEDALANAERSLAEAAGIVGELTETRLLDVENGPLVADHARNSETVSEPSHAKSATTDRHVLECTENENAAEEDDESATRGFAHAAESDSETPSDSKTTEAYNTHDREPLETMTTNNPTPPTTTDGAIAEDRSPVNKPPSPEEAATADESIDVIPDLGPTEELVNTDVPSPGSAMEAAQIDRPLENLSTPDASLESSSSVDGEPESTTSPNIVSNTDTPAPDEVTPSDSVEMPALPTEMPTAESEESFPSESPSEATIEDADGVDTTSTPEMTVPPDTSPSDSNDSPDADALEPSAETSIPTLSSESDSMANAEDASESPSSTANEPDDGSSFPYPPERVQEAVEQIELGIRKLVELLSGEVNEQWIEAKSAFADIVGKRGEVNDSIDQVRDWLTDVGGAREEALQAREDARTARDEAKRFREDSKIAKERAERSADAAEHAADAAHAEAEIAKQAGHPAP